MIEMNFADGKSRLDQPTQPKPWRIRLFLSAVVVVAVTLLLNGCLRLVSARSDIAVIGALLGILLLGLSTPPLLKLIWKRKSHA